MRCSPRRLLPVLAASTLVFAACGGSDDDADDTETTEAESSSTEAQTGATDADTETSEVEEEPATTEAETADTEPATDDTVADTTDTAASETTAESEPGDSEPASSEGGTEADPEAAGEANAASLVEWAIEAPTEYAAGSVTFDVSNDGEFPHEFVVIEGEGYESLPLEDGGKVIEEELPTGALVDRTSRIQPGETAQLTVDLAPGSYVLVCNLGSGGNSHAGAGQNLDVTVT